MTPEELEALLKAAANPDTAPEALLNLKDQVMALMTSNQQLTQDNANNTAKIQELHDTNMRLFLRASTPTQQTATDDLTDEQKDEYLGDLLFGRKERDDTTMKQIFDQEE